LFRSFHSLETALAFGEKGYPVIRNLAFAVTDLTDPVTARSQVHPDETRIRRKPDSLFKNFPTKAILPGFERIAEAGGFFNDF
jgi:hypothetical protein